MGKINIEKLSHYVQVCKKNSSYLHLQVVLYNKLIISETDQIYNNKRNALYLENAVQKCLYTQQFMIE